MIELQQKLQEYQALVLLKLERLAKPPLEGVESVEYELKADPDGDNPIRFTYYAPGEVLCEFRDSYGFDRDWICLPAEAVQMFIPNLDWYETAEALP